MKRCLPRYCSCRHGTALRLDASVLQIAVCRPHTRTMSLLRSLRNVLANLADRTDPAAVRAEANAKPSPEFMRRLAALESTEAFLGQLRPLVHPELHAALERSVAHADGPITSLQALHERVRAAQAGQAVAVGRAGWADAHPEAQYARELIALDRALAALRHRGVVVGGRESGPSGSV